MREKPDMITGRPTPVMLAFAMPILLGNLFQQLYNTVDAVVVGRYNGEAALAAIGVANPVMSVAIFFLFGVCMGISVLLAQFYGARDWPRFKAEVSTSLIAGGLFTLAISAVCLAVSGPVLRLTRTPPEIFADANAYLRIISCGLIFSFLYNFYASALRATGDSRTPFYFLLFSSALNIALDVAFVGALGMGVRGAAVATVLSQAASSLLCVLYVYGRGSALALRGADFTFDAGLLRTTAGYSWASALQQTFLYVGRLLIQTVINPLGTSVIAGYNAATRIEAFAISTHQALGDSEATFCAQNMGAGKPDRVRAGFWGAMRFGLLYSAALCAVLYFAAPGVMGLFSGGGEAEMIGVGVYYLRFMLPFYFLTGVNNAMQGMFRGVGLLRVTAACTGLQILWRVVLSYLFVPVYGMPAVCLSVGSGWVLMSAVEGVFVRRYFAAHPLESEAD